jgi:hypothetical protein
MQNKTHFQEPMQKDQISVLPSAKQRLLTSNPFLYSYNKQPYLQLD